MNSHDIKYSKKNQDGVYEYLHVTLPPFLQKRAPKKRLMTEEEWRELGIDLAPGWELYKKYRPEPHVLLFRRLRTDPPAKPSKRRLSVKF